MYQHQVDACSPKPNLTKRVLISGSTAEQLADVFEVLANDTRLRMLHALAIGGELSVSALADTVGMKTAAVSNQLQKLSLPRHREKPARREHDFLSDPRSLRAGTFRPRSMSD